MKQKHAYSNRCGVFECSSDRMVSPASYSLSVKNLTCPEGLSGSAENLTGHGNLSGEVVCCSVCITNSVATPPPPI
jgi:hypothetical protein